MTIMIVEDSKPMRNLIKRSLKQAGFGDHDIWEAGDGEEALGVLREKKPDIVLSDWNMPKMNGMALLQALKSEGIEVPFGFVTSEQSTEMRDAASTAGALFLIGKPFTAENFNRELSKVLQEEETDTTTVPLKDWLLCFAGTAKEVATNPLGYASASDIQALLMKCPRTTLVLTFHLMGAMSSSGSACFRTELEPSLSLERFLRLGPMMKTFQRMKSAIRSEKSSILWLDWLSRTWKRKKSLARLGYRIIWTPQRR